MHTREELNHIRDSAMGTACQGLTTAELEELNPNLLKAAKPMYEALQQLAMVYEVDWNSVAFRDIHDDYPVSWINALKALSLAEGKE